MSLDDATAKWVRRVNALAAEIEETASSLHPSAWREALKGLHEEYRKVAKDGPTWRSSALAQNKG